MYGVKGKLSLSSVIGIPDIQILILQVIVRRIVVPLRIPLVVLIPWREARTNTPEHPDEAREVLSGEMAECQYTKGGVEAVMTIHTKGNKVSRGLLDSIRRGRYSYPER